MQRGRLTAALSLGGVLAAGLAAALVNTQVLRSSAQDRSSAATTGVASSTLPTDATVPVVAPGESPSAPSASQAAYQIGSAGTVVLDTAGEVLSLVSATPSANWLVVAAEQTDARTVQVQLQSGSTLVTFRATLLLGVVSTSVESSVVSPGGPSGSTAPGVSVTLATAPGGAPPTAPSTGGSPAGGGTPSSTPTSSPATGPTVTVTTAPGGGTATTVDDSGSDDEPDEPDDTSDSDDD